MKKYACASKADLDILRASAGDQAHFTQHFFDWTPDDWQKQFAAAAQPNVCVLGGAGSGKTLGMLMGALWLCALVPHFKFLNVSYTAWQANIPFRIAAAMIEERDFQRLLRCKLKARPYPIIELWNGSTLEFMTVGRDAESLRGGEWDWINYDEGGLQYSEEVFAVLFGRLRGVRRRHCSESGAAAGGGDRSCGHLRFVPRMGTARGHPWAWHGGSEGDREVERTGYSLLSVGASAQSLTAKTRVCYDLP